MELSFKGKITLYYESNIHSSSSKELQKTLPKAEIIGNLIFCLISLK